MEAAVRLKQRDRREPRELPMGRQFRGIVPHPDLAAGVLSKLPLL